MPSVFLKNCILALWAGFFVWLATFGQQHLARLLHPKLWWLVICGAVVLLLFLAVNLRRPRAVSGQISLWWRWPTLLILVVPLAYCMMLPTARFNSQTFAQRALQDAEGAAAPGFVAPQSGEDEAEDGTTETSLTRLNAEAASLAGQEVEVVCQVMSDAKLPAGLMVCYRFRITCCAADAQPVFIFVTKPQGAVPANDAWVRAKGRLSVYEHRGYAIPLVTAETVVSEKEPAVPFLF